MKGRAERLETAGKWACLIGFLLVVLAGATHSGVLLAASVVFLGPAFVMPQLCRFAAGTSRRCRSAVPQPGRFSRHVHPAAAGGRADHPA